ncbi:hypothetical protein [Nostoc sp. DSM 114159]
MKSSPLALASAFGRRGHSKSDSVGGKRVRERLEFPQVEEHLACEVLRV